MCGEGAVALMRENWNKYAPRVLALESEADTSSINETINYKVLDILDKKLRPSGPSNKHPQAFSFYEVL